MKEHVEDPDKKPILIFPEGEFISNFFQEVHHKHLAIGDSPKTKNLSRLPHKLLCNDFI